MPQAADRRLRRSPFFYKTHLALPKERHLRLWRHKKTRLRMLKQTRTRAHTERLQNRRLAAISLLALTLLPVFLVAFEFTQFWSMYQQVQAGLNHVQAATRIFQTPPSSPSSNPFAFYLDAERLQQAQREIDMAHTDFAALSNALERSEVFSLAATCWPAQVQTIRALGTLAADGTAVAQRLLETARAIAPSLALALQSSPSNAEDVLPQPFLTPSSYQAIYTTLDAIAPLVHQMAVTAQGLSLTSLPLSPRQQEMLTTFVPLLPVLDSALAQRGAFQDPLAWFLGINQQRTFLIEPMDKDELRPTGGFTGQFGELVLNGAHPGSIKFSNIGKYEEDHSYLGSPPDPTVYPKVVGQTAPEPYAEWWPIPNFGMRDANVSADFPTSARIVMNRYSYEFGRNVDGVIMFTPTLIEKVLHVTGPIPIPAYNQVVTEYNLESLLHFYQLNNGGIYQEQLVEHVSDTELARKLFTQRVTNALITTVSHLPLNKLLTLAGDTFAALKTKDLQVYVTNPQAEALLGIYGSTASLDRSTTHDGFFVVQANLSASKAAQYVQTTIQDSVTLDNQGGATHHLQLTLDYNQTGDPYGFDTYRDYVRVYVPPDSQFISGNGFDQYDEPYCGDAQSGYRLCQPDVYGDGTLVCTTTPTIGLSTDYLHDPYYRTDHPLDRIGPPQNQTSDEAGRAMFGGWVVIPKDCSIRVTLSWYVPPMGQQPYSLLVQAQAGVDATLALTIQPPAALCAASQAQSLRILQAMDGEDTMFTLNHQGAGCSLTSS